MCISRPLSGKTMCTSRSALGPHGNKSHSLAWIIWFQMGSLTGCTRVSCTILVSNYEARLQLLLSSYLIYHVVSKNIHGLLQMSFKNIFGQWWSCNYSYFSIYLTVFIWVKLIPFKTEVEKTYCVKVYEIRKKERKACIKIFEIVVERQN